LSKEALKESQIRKNIKIMLTKLQAAGKKVIEYGLD
jgi:hypothetical protein